MKQKARIKWFEEGDTNNKYFHSVIRERKRRLCIHRIKINRGKWISGDAKITKVAIKHFEKTFNLPPSIIDHNILDVIAECISHEDNPNITKCPQEKEIREAIFYMSPNSAPGPDGYSGKFYQLCWNIIKKDVIEFVQFFFQKEKLTKFFSHTLLALIPKIDSPSCFSDMRPISLSNISCKIITKILSRRLNPLLPNMISENQSDFLKGRLITENILLTQEIVQGIKTKNIGGNVVMKIDMSKTYDRMSWSFISAVLKKFGFNDEVIDFFYGYN